MKMTSNPKFDIVVCGKFHFFNYVKELDALGYLEKFYYSHKPSTAASYNVRPEVVANFALKEYLVQLHGRVLGEKLIDDLFPIYESIWAKSVLRKWRPGVGLHCLANGTSMPFVRAATNSNTRILAEVVNTHPQHRLDLLNKERAYWKIGGPDMRLLGRHKRTLDECASADAILVPTTTVKESFLSNGYQGRIFKIPYAANTTRFYEKTRVLASRKKLNVVCVGQIGLRKGQLHLLKAIKNLGPDKVNLTLVGFLSLEVQQAIEPYRNMFTHIERIPSSEMRDFYSSQDVFVLPSLEEGLAVSICEAMACGLAVVATAEAGGDELIINGVTGLIVPSRDAPALQLALERFIKDPDLMEYLGAAAAAATKKRHNWVGYAKELSGVYDSLVNGVDGTEQFERQAQ